jgi:hypothetical protein
MPLIATILLGLILITLIIMMLVFLGAFTNLLKHVESIDETLSGMQESIRKLEDRSVDIIDHVTNISNLSIDMKYHQKQLRELEMTTAIEELKSIESSMSDLKLFNETLLSLKKSMETSIAHSTFAKSNEVDGIA